MTEQIFQYFARSAQLYPERIAIIERDVQISYATLDKKIDDTMAYFQSKGIGAGDRVLVFVPMSIDLYRITLALFKLGATAVFLDEWVSLKRLKMCCEMAECKGFIASWKIRFLGTFVPAIREIPVFLSSTKMLETSKKQPASQVKPDQAALITFTTGSVGKPKAAVRSHQFLHFQFQALEHLIKNQNEREMIMLPIVLLLNLGAGKTSVLPDFKFSKPATFNPELLINQIQKHQIEGIIASPSYLLELAQYALANNIKINLKTISSGGAAIFPKDADLVSNAFPSAMFQIIYGSTEAEPISHCAASELIAHRQNQGVYVGKVDAATQLKILNTQDLKNWLLDEKSFLELEQNTGIIGEIMVSGNHVLDSYLNNEEILPKNKISVGDVLWHRTGDSGYLDHQGALFLTGRINQIFKIGETAYYPFVAENLIKNIAGVKLGTILKKSNEMWLIYQGQSEVEPTQFTALFPDLKQENIRRVKEIPVDPRHRSKIDYLALEILAKTL